MKYLIKEYQLTQLIENVKSKDDDKSFLDRMYVLVDTFMRINYPEFLKENAKFIEHPETIEYYGPYRGKKLNKYSLLARYYKDTNELYVADDIVNKFDGVFGEENMNSLVEWFGKEFDKEVVYPIINQ